VILPSPILLVQLLLFDWKYLTSCSGSLYLRIGLSLDDFSGHLIDLYAIGPVPVTAPTALIIIVEHPKSYVLYERDAPDPLIASLVLTDF